MHPVQVKGKLSLSKEWKYYVTKMDEEATALEGRFDPKTGVIVKANYLKIEWPDSERYHIVITKEGLVRYLDSAGQELFD